MTRLRDDGRGIVLVAIASGWFLSLGARMIYPAVLPYIRASYGLDLATAGLLITVLWLAYAIGQLPGGILADRIGERNVLVVSSAVAAVMLTLVSIADSATVVFAATALFGFGTALYGVARFTAISTVFPDHDGAAIGITLAAGQLGNTILPPVAGALAAAVAWQLGFGVTIPLFVLAAAFIYAVVPERSSKSNSAVDSLSLDTVRYVFGGLRRPSILTVFAVQTLVICAWQAFTGFYPTYLIEIKGFRPAVATTLFGLFFALGIVVQPLTGSAYDRYGIRRTLPSVLVLILVGFVVLPLATGFWPIVGITILLSSLLGYGAITLPYLTAALPDDMQGTGLGLLRTVYISIGALSPLAFGAIAGLGFFDEAFWLLAALVLAAIVLSRWLPERESA